VPGQASGIGQLKWSFRTQGMIVSSPAIGPNGTIYIGSDDGHLYALDEETGAKKWSFPAKADVMSSPAIGTDGTVYFGSQDNNVYALDGTTGAKKWSFSTVNNVSSSPAIGMDGTVYVGCVGSLWDSDCSLYALDGANGSLKWSFPAGSGVGSSPAIGVDGTVYIGSCDRNVYALDGKTGAKKWSFSTSGEVFSSAAIGADGTVYIGSCDHNVYALDGATGTKKWSFATGDGVESSPTIAVDGTVYVGSFDRNVYALDGKTGAPKWVFTTGSGVYSSAAIALDGTVYIASFDRNVYALDAKTGVPKWVFATGEYGYEIVFSSPAVGRDGTVYIGSSDHQVYALQGSSGLANTPWPKFRQNAQNDGHIRFAPLMLRQPSRVVLNEGSRGQITAKASGVPRPTLSWLSNGLPIAGADQATLTIPSVSRAAEGLYTLVASNALGLVTSKPIVVLVSNVKPQQWIGLKWQGGTNGLVTLESTTQVGASASWHSLSNYPSNGATQTYVETSSANAARFYRLSSTEATPINGAGFVNGWSMTEPAGTRLLVEVTSEVSGWTNWQVLTNLTLPASPHLFLDPESLGAPDRVYRTTIVP
jgi:outer membrane protein assembly factor BamB